MNQTFSIHVHKISTKSLPKHAEVFEHLPHNATRSRATLLHIRRRQRLTTLAYQCVDLWPCSCTSGKVCRKQGCPTAQGIVQACMIESSKALVVTTIMVHHKITCTGIVTRRHSATSSKPWRPMKPIAWLPGFYAAWSARYLPWIPPDTIHATASQTSLHTVWAG